MATKRKKIVVKQAKKPTRKQSLLHRFGVASLLLLAITIQLVGNSSSSSGSVLAYATNISVSGLQSAQNTKRINNGLPSLTLNTQLNSAAQAKANDMIARNYWSHNTPDGSPPWIFFTNAGYSYYKAGENLAYGFDTSIGVVNGWMNSSAHRANVLDASYKDVGFGIANGSNYQGDENTVVVAMYGQPAAVATTPSPAPSPSTPAPKSASVAPTPTPPPTTSPTPSPPTASPPTSSPAPGPEASSSKSEDKEKSAKPFTSTTSDSTPPSSKTTVMSSIWHGTARWTAYVSFLFTLSAGSWMIVKHTKSLKLALVNGEAYVLTHPAFEVSLLSVAMLLLFAGTRGVIN